MANSTILGINVGRFSRALRDIQLQRTTNLATLSWLGSLGVWGSYKIRTRRKYTAIRTKAHFTGISNPNSQSILFLSNSCITCCLVIPAAASLLDPELISRISGSFGASSCNITISQASVKTPGKINIADFCRSPWRKSPGAPGATQLPK